VESYGRGEFSETDGSGTPYVEGAKIVKALVVT